MPINENDDPAMKSLRPESFRRKYDRCLRQHRWTELGSEGRCGTDEITPKLVSNDVAKFLFNGPIIDLCVDGL
jgi:hypothetical protein